MGLISWPCRAHGEKRMHCLLLLVGPQERICMGLCQSHRSLDWILMGFFGQSFGEQNPWRIVFHILEILTSNKPLRPNPKTHLHIQFAFLAFLTCHDNRNQIQFYDCNSQWSINKNSDVFSRMYASYFLHIISAS